MTPHDIISDELTRRHSARSILAALAARGYRLVQLEDYTPPRTFVVSTVGVVVVA